MALKDADYYKSLAPSHLLQERGSDIVVIAPGSANLRIGLASTPLPLSVPHCIARYSSGLLTIAQKRRKGAARWQLRATQEISAEREENREESVGRLQSLLGVNIVPTGNNDGAAEACAILPPEADAFPWTDVYVARPPLPTAADDMATGASSSATPPGSTSQEGQRTPPQGGPEATTSGDHSDANITHRKSICGEQALKIPASEPYIVRRPMSRGRLAVSPSYSMQEVCDDFVAIWSWALQERLGVSRAKCAELWAVLVAPDTLDARELKEMVNVILSDLNFRGIVIHHESLCCAFGNGTPSTCVVNVGAQVSTVVCIDDGAVLPQTKVVLPFGGEDITRTLLWLQRRARAWPHRTCDPLSDPMDLALLEEIKEEHAIAKPDWDHEISVEVRVRCRGSPTKAYAANLAGALVLAPMGLIHPTLFCPEEVASGGRSVHQHDHEDMLRDEEEAALPLVDGSAAGGGGRKSDVSQEGGAKVAGGSATVVPGVATPEGRAGGTSSSASKRASLTPKDDNQSVMGLHQAIAASIVRTGRSELAKKLFSSIQLAGGVASTKGLSQWLEKNLLRTVPRRDYVDRVEVVPTRCDPKVVAWRGGVVLAVLDHCRDEGWLRREEWREGGVVPGGEGHPYRESNGLQSKVFYYLAGVE